MQLATRRHTVSTYVALLPGRRGCRALRNVLGVQPRECGVVLTEPYLNLPALRQAALQVGCRMSSVGWPVPGLGFVELPPCSCLGRAAGWKAGMPSVGVVPEGGQCC